MKEYYIIRFRRKFCRGFYYGTREELVDALSRVGAEVVCEEPISFERIGLVFKRVIRTRIKVYGRDTAFYERFYNDIKGSFDRYGVSMYDELKMALARAGERYCNLDAEDLFDVLVSDGTENKESGTIYIGMKSGYRPFSDFDEDDFWYNMGYHVGVSRPQDRQLWIEAIG